MLLLPCLQNFTEFKLHGQSILPRYTCILLYIIRTTLYHDSILQAPTLFIYLFIFRITHFLVGFQYGQVLVGTAGNTRLILREGIRDKPTVLDIIHLKMDPEPAAVTDRIFYRSESN